MKKLVSLLLVLTLLLSATALGKAFAVTQETCDTDDFTIALPEGWFVVDESIMSIVDALVNSGLMDASVSNEMKTAYNQVRAYGVFMIMAPDYKTNISIAASYFGKDSDANMPIAPPRLALFPAKVVPLTLAKRVVISSSAFEM